MDVLADVLHTIHLEARLFCRSEFIAPWGMNLTAQHGASFHIVERGSCWLRLSGVETPIPLTAGDLIMLPNASLHELSDAPAGETRPLRDLLLFKDEQGRVCVVPQSRGLSTTLICGEFRFAQGGIHPLFSMFPPLIHIRGENGQAVEWLSTSLKFIAAEAANMRPGRETILSRLMDILFIMVIRYWIDCHALGQRGWLGALSNPQILAALGAIHQSPAQAWTVESLASEVNMSRSAFSARFTELVGESPLKYLTRWRMQLAINWLGESGLSLDEIAQRVGYETPYAFGKAFKRMVHVAPGEYRKQMKMR